MNNAEQHDNDQRADWHSNRAINVKWDRVIMVAIVIGWIIWCLNSK